VVRRLYALGLVVVMSVTVGCVKQDRFSHAHKTGHLTYADTPPMGGAHSEYWLRCGVYAEPVPNENAVHSLEHGAVWLTYQPGLAPDLVRRLAELAKIKPAYVLVSPYPGQDQPVYATAWGHQYFINTSRDEGLRRFILKYAGGGQGGEKGHDCAHGVSPQDAKTLLDNPSYQPPSFGT
jgi:hypothetical protein